MQETAVKVSEVSTVKSEVVVPSQKHDCLPTTLPCTENGQSIKPATLLEQSPPALPVPCVAMEECVADRPPCAEEKAAQTVETPPVRSDPNCTQEDHRLPHTPTACCDEPPRKKAKLDPVVGNEPSDSKSIRAGKHSRATDSTEQGETTVKDFRTPSDSKLASTLLKQPQIIVARVHSTLPPFKTALQENKDERTSANTTTDRSNTERSKKAASKSRGSPRKRSVQLKRKKQVGSTSSMNEASVDDVGIVCSLCSKVANVFDLGFLYGPYKASSKKEAAPLDLEKKAKSIEEGSSDLHTEPVSVWVHEDCAVWAPGVCLVNGQMLGLSDAIEDGAKMVGCYYQGVCIIIPLLYLQSCSMCVGSGATLYCSAHGCKLAYHFPCAKASGEHGSHLLCKAPHIASCGHIPFIKAFVD